MLLLLKEKNKIGIAHKNRKTFEPLLPNKHMKTDNLTQPSNTSARGISEESKKPEGEKKKIKAKVTERYDETMEK